MKIAILSLGGNVGCTTIAAHCLYPRLHSAKTVAIGYSSSTYRCLGIDAEEMSQLNIRQLSLGLIRHNNLIADVSSLQSMHFCEELQKYNLFDEFDAYVIPSMPDQSSQRLAYKTIEVLLANGVPKSKVKVVFNMVEKSTVDEFDFLLGALEHHQIPYNLEATIYRNESFYLFLLKKTDVESALRDQTDFRKLIQDESSEQELDALIGSFLLKKAAPRIAEAMEMVFRALFQESQPQYLSSIPDQSNSSINDDAGSIAIQNTNVAHDVITVTDVQRRTKQLLENLLSGEANFYCVTRDNRPQFVLTRLINIHGRALLERRDQAITVSDIQRNAKEIFNKLQDGTQDRFIVIRDGKPLFEFLPIAAFPALANEVVG